MPVKLNGSCRCGSVTFSVESHTPYPYQLCYCSICRKTAGGGGFAINLMGTAESLSVKNNKTIRIYSAEFSDHGVLKQGTGRRHFCSQCGSALWLFDPEWPDLVHPFASAIDTNLAVPPSRVHLMLQYKASWVQPVIGTQDECFDEYPKESIEDWHRKRGLWID